MCRGGDNPRLCVRFLVALSRLPAQEGISHIINYVPDVLCIARARVDDCDYVPPHPREGVDVHHLRGGLACPTGRTTLSAGLRVPEGVVHSAIIPSNQAANIIAASHAAGGIGVAHSG